MNIPDKIKIGGHSFKVKFPYDFRGWNVKQVGACNYEKCTLYLSDTDHVMHGSTKIANSVILQTFLHEILHAVNIIYYDDRLDETGVTQISEGIFQVLKDNPSFTKLFLSKRI